MGQIFQILELYLFLAFEVENFSLKSCDLQFCNVKLIFPLILTDLKFEPFCTFWEGKVIFLFLIQIYLLKKQTKIICNKTEKNQSKYARINYNSFKHEKTAFIYKNIFY